MNPKDVYNPKDNNSNYIDQNKSGEDNNSSISDKYSVTEKSGNSSKINEDISQEKRSKTEYDGNSDINFNNDQNLDLGINSERKDIIYQMVIIMNIKML